MAEVTSIHPADLRKIENFMGAVHNDLQVLDSGVGTVNDNVKVVYDEVGKLAQDFYAFVSAQVRANRLGQAEVRLVKIRQELEKKYGHYDLVRRTTTGILQADDLGIVKKDTISSATEELMISTPGYWLAPCLVALAAWINDQPELADKALREGIKRNDEKTSLFFALVCRRADRKNASLKWTQRYLANQDEENLDRKTIIILDAFASGLLGADSEGVVSRQMDEWLDHLSAKPGFVEKQTVQWSEAINLKRKPLEDTSYTYLKKYSKTWPVLEDIMEGANLHAEILSYFTSIFEQEVSTDSLKEQLDDILDSLVTDFDDEELPLRKEEKFEQFVVDFEGDEDRARQNMAVEQTAFETHKDFTQLLTDAAMKPESSHASASTQKFAIALSKEWITNAYSDVTAQNRMKIPNEIEVNVDTFNDKTTDGQNEQELLGKFNSLVDQEKTAALDQLKLTQFDQFCLYGGGVIAAIGLGMLVAGSMFLGIIAIVAGIGLILNHFSKKKKIETSRQNIETQFEQKRTNGSQIIRALLAEVVDFRAEFDRKDAQSQQVMDFLDQITPEQYVRKLADSNRRVKVQ
ncbi:hypothetical protein [Faecalicatena fissicatena]|uniref:Uncharacterized protein n=1 Tax=Faecalicatena fissicatena TaxID=290055 RepID=A0ABS2E898_9FIRM|nr:hypothetical protein [Faecalicatena fissicatena]MBM6737834.1 hypothetical protein [Faecalicatena fissicatena]